MTKSSALTNGELAAAEKALDQLKLREIHEQVVHALNELRPLFIDQAELTFIMRVPGMDDSEIVISNDEPAELVKVIAGWSMKVSKELRNENIDPETGWHSECEGSCELAGDAYCAKDRR